MNELQRLLVESEPPPPPSAEAVVPTERSGRREVEPALPDSIERIDWMGRGAWVVSGALAAAVVVALVVWKPEPAVEASAAGARPASGQVELPGGELVTPTIVRLAQARLFAYGGPVLRDGMELPPGGPLREGDALEFAGAACLRLEPGALVCAEPGSRVSLNSLALTHRVLEVHAGGAVAELANLPAGASFVMRTGGLRLRGREGQLALRRSEDDASRVWLTQGRAEVRRGIDVLELAAGQGAHWSTSEGLQRSRVDAAAREWVVEVLRASQVPQPSREKRAVKRRRPAVASAKSVSPAPAPAGPEEPETLEGSSGVDDPELVGDELLEPSTSAGASPSPAPAGPEASAASVQSETALEPEASEVPNEAVAGADEADEPAEVDTSSPASADPAPPAPAAPDPVELLLRQARVAADRGDYWQAEREYRELREDFPRDPRAHSAMVQLGDLRLHEMDDALGALGFYRRYLDAGSGALDAQARLGVIAALERLKRYPHERKAIREYLDRYPNSPQTARLQQRLELLGGE